MKKDKIVKYETLYEENQNNNTITVKIQRVERKSGREAIQAFIPLTRTNHINGAVSLTFTYHEIKAILDGLIKMRGEEEVERELNIKIQEEGLRL